MERHIEQLPSGAYRVRLIYRGVAHYSPSVDTLEEAINKRNQLYAQFGLAGHAVVEPTYQPPEQFSEEELDELEEQALARAVQVSQAKLAKTSWVPEIPFSNGPIAIVFVGDIHLGNSGTDHERAFNDAEIIANTPGMYIWLMGDLVDSFIKASIISARFGAPLTITEEWVLLRRYLRILAPKILGASGSGPHHDGWIRKLTGVDFFKESLKEFAPKALYDSDQVYVKFKIGNYEVPAKLRHKWGGSSIYNATHGIERAAQLDGDFLLGVGGHKHGRGLSREFAVGGRDGLAVQVGSYKRADDYAMEIGVQNDNHAVAIAVLFDEVSQTMTGFRDLELAAYFLQQVYSR